MSQLEDSELLGRVIETLNENYPDDLMNQAYDMLLEDEPYDIGDPLAVFIVSEVASIVEPGKQTLRAALKTVAMHLQTQVEDLQALRKAIIS